MNFSNLHECLRRRRLWLWLLSLSFVLSVDGEAWDSHTSQPESVRQITQTVIASSLNPVFVTIPVTFVVKVTGQSGSLPTGVVTLKSGSEILGTTALSRGSGSITINFTKRGTTAIKGYYSGDPHYSPSISSELFQAAISAPTSASIATSENPSHQGQAVIFTAIVNSPVGGPKDGERVNFREGKQNLGLGMFVNGVAVFRTVALSAGTHDIVAAYGGNRTLNKAVSPAFRQRVY